jgi:hypothetical protein
MKTKTIQLYRTSDDRLYRHDDTLRRVRLVLLKSRKIRHSIRSSGVEVIEIPVSFYMRNRDVIQQGGFKPLNIGG